MRVSCSRWADGGRKWSHQDVPRPYYLTPRARGCLLQEKRAPATCKRNILGLSGSRLFLPLDEAQERPLPEVIRVVGIKRSPLPALQSIVWDQPEPTPDPSGSFSARIPLQSPRCRSATQRKRSPVSRRAHEAAWGMRWLRRKRKADVAEACQRAAALIKRAWCCVLVSATVTFFGAGEPPAPKRAGLVSFILSHFHLPRAVSSGIGPSLAPEFQARPRLAQSYRPTRLELAGHWLLASGWSQGTSLSWCLLRCEEVPEPYRCQDLRNAGTDQIHPPPMRRMTSVHWCHIQAPPFRPSYCRRPCQQPMYPICIHPPRDCRDVRPGRVHGTCYCWLFPFTSWSLSTYEVVSLLRGRVPPLWRHLRPVISR